MGDFVVPVSGVSGARVARAPDGVLGVLWVCCGCVELGVEIRDSHISYIAVKNANLVSGFPKSPKSALAPLIAALAAALALAGLAGCGQNGNAGAGASLPAAATPPAAAKTSLDYFTINVAAQPVRMQLAVEQPDNTREMERGLMGRRDLAEDQGMIFIYRNAQRMTFWMRNTPTALDIGFFTKDGALTEVRQMFPFDETTVPSARADIQFALEMNQGWFAHHNLAAGARLDLRALAAALKARGFNPADYGITVP